MIRSRRKRVNRSRRVRVIRSRKVRGEIRSRGRRGIWRRRVRLRRSSLARRMATATGGPLILIWPPRFFRPHVSRS